MIILGIDPGTGRTGWGIIKVKSDPFDKTQGHPEQSRTDEKLKVKSQNTIGYVAHGCITTPSTHTMPQRLLQLRKELKQLIREHQPHCLVIEQLFFGQNSKTAMNVGQARGVIMATAAEHKLPVFEYQCLRVKLALSGYGRADKKTIQKKVRKFLGLSPKEMAFKPKDGGDDAADALAVAIYHVLSAARQAL